METKLFANLTEEPRSPSLQHQQSVIKAQEILSPKNQSMGVEQHVELLQRIQKLELATNRLLNDSGKMGEGYMLPVPTASEDAIALAQKKQIDQLMQRIDELESLQVQQ